MLLWTCALLCIWGALAASTSPLVSNLGNGFRSGEATVTVAGQTQYDFNVPYPSTLSGNSAALALSMTDYSQQFDASNKVFYRLWENTPTSSNGTHAVFRVELGKYPLTSKAKVKYLACPASTLSQNFNIIVSHFSPGTLSSGASYDFPLGTSLNTAAGYSSAFWMSGIEAAKASSKDTFYIWTYFLNAPYRIRVQNKAAAAMCLASLRVTLIFMHDSATTITGNYKLPYQKYFHSNYTFPFPLNSQSSWFDASNVICGVNNLQFASDTYQYSTAYFGNKVSFESKAKGADGDWADSLCFVAAFRVCRSTHPHYDPSTNLCYDSCAGQNANNYVCNCPANCYGCSWENVCTGCYPGFFKRTDNLCYSSCTNGTFANSETETCDQCPTVCAECTSMKNCSSCRPLFELRNSYCYERDPDPDPDPGPDSNPPTVLIVVIVAVIAVLGGVGYFLKKKCQNPRIDPNPLVLPNDQEDDVFHPAINNERE